MHSVGCTKFEIQFGKSIKFNRNGSFRKAIIHIFINEYFLLGQKFTATSSTLLVITDINKNINIYVFQVKLEFHMYSKSNMK